VGLGFDGDVDFDFVANHGGFAMGNAEITAVERGGAFDADQLCPAPSVNGAVDGDRQNNLAVGSEHIQVARDRKGMVAGLFNSGAFEGYF